MESHNVKQPTPVDAPAPPMIPEPTLPTPPSSRHVDVVTCPDRASAFRVEGEVDGEVRIDHTGSTLSVEDLEENDGVSFHVRIYAPGVTTIAVSGSTSLRVLDLCGGRLRVTSSGSSSIEIMGRLDTLELDSSGSTALDLTDVKTRELDIDTSGSTSVRARGDAERIDIDTSGSSSVDAFGMKAEHVRVDSSGSAAIRVCVTGSLSANMSGSGDVVYDCAPADISHDISGSGSVRAR